MRYAYLYQTQRALSLVCAQRKTLRKRTPKKGSPLEPLEASPDTRVRNQGALPTAVQFSSGGTEHNPAASAESHISFLANRTPTGADTGYGFLCSVQVLHGLQHGDTGVLLAGSCKERH